jgi:hypothetical protein
MAAPRPALLALLALALARAAGAARAAAPSTAPPAKRAGDGVRQPWLIVWRRGVNGTRMYERLCPSVSLPEEPPLVGPAAARRGPPRAAAGGDEPWGAPLWDAPPPPLTACGALYDKLLNGLAGAHAAAHAARACGVRMRRAHGAQQPLMRAHARRPRACTPNNGCRPLAPTPQRA